MRLFARYNPAGRAYLSTLLVSISPFCADPIYDCIGAIENPSLVLSRKKAATESFKISDRRVTIDAEI
jgi:hypothetical protein